MFFLWGKGYCIHKLRTQQYSPGFFRLPLVLAIPCVWHWISQIHFRVKLDTLSEITIFYKYTHTHWFKITVCLWRIMVKIVIITIIITLSPSWVSLRHLMVAYQAAWLCVTYLESTLLSGSLLRIGWSNIVHMWRSRIWEVFQWFSLIRIKFCQWHV